MLSLDREGGGNGIGVIELRHRHLLLIRDPVNVLLSWVGKSGNVHGNNLHLDELGITSLMDVYAKIVSSYAMMGQDENNEHECGDGGNGYDGDDDYGISSSSSPTHEVR